MAQQLFNIQDDKVVINKLALRYLEGSVIHAGSFDIVGNASIQNNLTVAGSITVDTLNVKNLVTEESKLGNPGSWSVVSEHELEGQGFSWAWGTGAAYLSYQLGNRLWTNGNFDLGANSSYMIDNTVVLSLTELSPQVSKSRLKEVGPLKSLTVTGDTNLGDIAFVNSNLGRLGINTDQPNGSFSVVDNTVEVVIDAPNYGIANIGTYSNHDLNFITDNTPRFSIKNNGEIIFGNCLTKSASVTIYGSLKVENLVSDTRIDRYSSLEFKPNRDQLEYGLGLVWRGSTGTHSLVLRDNPDQFWSSLSINLNNEKAYLINGDIVLSQHELGQHVTRSNLKSLGALESLYVEGDSRFNGNIIATTSKFESISCGNIFVSGPSINSEGTFSVKVSEDEVFYADNMEISIGNKLNTRRATKIFGPLTVGVSNPDTSVKLEVAGDVKFNNKKFVSGVAVPTEGSFIVGDICWNQTPTPGNYVGWVCITEGTPGQWAPFGAITQDVS